MSEAQKNMHKPTIPEMAIPSDNSFFEAAALLITSPPQKRNQHNLLEQPKRLLQKVRKLDPFSKRDRELLTQITQISRISSVKNSAITLTPAIRDERLMKAIYDLSAYYIQLRRDGYVCYPGSIVNDEMAFLPEKYPQGRIWCSVSVRSYATVTSISITHDSKHEYDKGGKRLLSDKEAEYLRSSCVSDCAILVQNFLDDLRQIAIEQLTQPSYNTKLLPKLESISAHRIVFSNISASDKLYDSGIPTVLNRAKNVYTDGDPAGRKAYRSKRSRGETVLNTSLRMKVGFSVRHSKNQLIIEFWFDSSNKPFFIIPCSHNEHRKMTDREAEACRLSFARLCATSLSTYFEQIHDQAIVNGTTPNYLQPWPDNMEDCGQQVRNSPLDLVVSSVLKST